jgi:mannose-6-phosphate isomerase-like protein (cupin superfamily)
MATRILPAMALRNVGQVEARRISPSDTNYFALLFSPDDAVDVVCVVEIFTVGGKTPPNSHQRAHEFFYVLSGEGKAICAGTETPLAKGDALMLRPGTEHIVENTGSAKLYTLTFMVPNEAFAELIQRGERVELDDEDRATLLVLGNNEANS